MKELNLRRFLSIPVPATLLLVGSTLSAQAGPFGTVIEPSKEVIVFEDPPERASRWRVSSGYIWRSFDNVQFQTGSFSQHAFSRAPFGDNRFVLPLVGDRFAPDNRLYDDGFLLIDVSGSADGLTWNWGYDDAGQISGDTLVLRNSHGTARDVTGSSAYKASTWQDSVDTGGPYVQVDYLVDVSDRVSIGPQLSVAHFNLDTARRSSTFNARSTSTEYRVTVEDTVDLGGIIPPLAPFEGSFDGPGALIAIVPTNRSVDRSQTGFGSIDLFNEIDERLDADILTISPGVSAEFSHERLFVSVAAGMAINVVDWDAHHDETLFVSRNGGRPSVADSWHSHNSGTDVLLGAYVQAAAGVEVTERVSISGFVRYDWSEDFHGTVGPSSFDLDMSGFSGGVMATIQF